MQLLHSFLLCVFLGYIHFVPVCGFTFLRKAPFEPGMAQTHQIATVEYVTFV